MKKFQKWLILWSAVLLTALFQIWYCREYVPRQVVLVQTEMVLEHQPLALDGVRLALISDLHCDRQDTDAGLYRRSAALIRDAAPDAVFFLGDYRNRLPERKNIPPEEIAELMADFVPQGVAAFAIGGNHDAAQKQEKQMEELEKKLLTKGIHFLHNQTVPLSLRGEIVAVGGVDDLPETWAKTGDIWEKCAQKFRILLCHRPEYFASIALDADLMLSGHTHAGQVSLPVLKDRYRVFRWQENYFPRGAFQREDGKQLYVTSGVGTSTLRLRMNCPPEVVILTLKAAGK